MSAFELNLTPRDIPFIKTGNRVIGTKIPVPESLSLLEEIKNYESSNAVEQLPVVWGSAINHQIFDEFPDEVDLKSINLK